jgi:AAA family ATP:ADP antiporter
LPQPAPACQLLRVPHPAPPSPPAARRRTPLQPPSRPLLPARRLPVYSHDGGDLEDAAAAGAAPREPAAPQQQQPGEPPRALGWRRLALAPLEAASTLHNEDAHYLEKRQRSRWWNREAFPKVPTESLAEAHENPPALATWVKVLPLGAIFFAASFNLTILASLKDSIMVTTAGAETLPFLASFVVLPASLAFFMLYGRMVEALPARAVFYAAVAPLLAFYVLFTLVLYPMHATLHPAGLVDAVSGWVPAGLLGLVKVAQYWTFSLFYCFAELWGSVVISVLFWSLANEVCTVTEAKSVYPLMGVAANVALVLSGSFVKHVNRTLAAGSTHAMLCWLVGGIVAMTALMGLAKAALDHWVIGPYCSIDPATGAGPRAPPRAKKSRGSLGESLAVIRASPKIMNLAVLVVSYGVSHRLFEFAWKGALRTLYPTPQAYQSVLADVSIATGWATISFMLLGKFVFQYLGWGAAASATPLAMLVSGGAFFGLSLASWGGVSVWGLDPAAMAFAGVAAGAVTQVFARSSKFSLFDPAKEMVYIEMSREEKSKGKAAVDLLGSQIGKSGGAWITQLLLLATGSFTASLPVISAAFVAVIASWLAAVGSLGRQLKDYDEEVKAKADAKAAARAAGAPPGGANGAGANGAGAAAGVPAAAPQGA